MWDNFEGPEYAPNTLFMLSTFNALSRNTPISPGLADVVHRVRGGPQATSGGRRCIWLEGCAPVALCAGWLPPIQGEPPGRRPFLHCHYRTTVTLLAYIP